MAYGIFKYCFVAVTSDNGEKWFTMMWCITFINGGWCRCEILSYIVANQRPLFCSNMFATTAILVAESSSWRFRHLWGPSHQITIRNSDNLIGIPGVLLLTACGLSGHQILSPSRGILMDPDMYQLLRLPFVITPCTCWNCGTVVQRRNTGSRWNTHEAQQHNRKRQRLGAMATLSRS